MNLSKIITIMTFLLFIASFTSCDNKEQTNGNNDANTQYQQENTNNTNNTTPDTVKAKDSVELTIPVEINVDKVKFGPAPEMFRQGMNDIFDAYMSITYSMCFSDPKGVKVGTAVFKDMQSRIDPSLISGEMRSYWDNYSENLSSVIANIEASNDLNVQRKYYSILSELMTVAIKNYRIKDKVVKKYNCPQALDGKGAYWYFEDSPAYTLMNPYLGQESKDCLKPVETLNYNK